MQQIDRGKRGQHADDGGEHHQPQIMGVRNAIVDLQHGKAPSEAEISRFC
jgi:hypothetical protein